MLKISSLISTYFVIIVVEIFNEIESARLLVEFWMVNGRLVHVPEEFVDVLLPGDIRLVGDLVGHRLDKQAETREK